MPEKEVNHDTSMHTACTVVIDELGYSLESDSALKLDMNDWVPPSSSDIVMSWIMGLAVLF